jgi:hypothetical protein
MLDRGTATSTNGATGNTEADGSIAATNVSPNRTTTRQRMSMTGSTFRTDQPLLQELLEEIHKGNVQLPDFQRGWVWDDQHIRALIASVSLSYPIGAVMLLETGGDGAKFQPRPVEGAPAGAAQPGKLILDGQQRLTSLYLAMRSGKPVPTTTDKDKEIDRVYYLDMKACLVAEADRLDAIRSLPTDRILRSDFGRTINLDVSTAEKEHAADLFPLHFIFDSAAASQWRRGYRKFHDNSSTKMDLLDAFEEQITLRFLQYKVPVIELLRGTPKEAVCQVTFAADNYRLRQNWDERAARLHKKHQVLADVDGADFLTAVTLCSMHRRHKAGNGAVGCKRRDILNLTLAEYQATADEIEEGLVRAARFLNREHVFDTKGLPYQTQLVPLSVICAELGVLFETDSVRQKLARWYWAGVFGELYGGANEARFAFDVPEVLEWIQGSGAEPRTIRDSNFAPTRLLSLQTRLSAAYKGVMAQLSGAGSEDFISGDPITITSYFDREIDIHHIFPRAYCEKVGLDRLRWNSVINKGPLSKRSNQVIGGHKPSTYLNSIENPPHNVAPDRLDEILQSHLIDDALLRKDDFDGFLRARGTKLLDLIESATGKQVTGRDSDETVAAFGAPLVASAAPSGAETFAPPAVG